MCEFDLFMLQGRGQPYSTTSTLQFCVCKSKEEENELWYLIDTLINLVNYHFAVWVRET